MLSPWTCANNDTESVPLSSLRYNAGATFAVDMAPAKGCHGRMSHLLNRDLSRTDRAVLTYITEKTRENPMFRATIQKIMDFEDLSRTSVYGILANLIKAGAITRSKSGLGSTVHEFKLGK